MSINTKILLFCIALILLFIVAFISKRKKKFIPILGILSLIYGTIYIVWRLFFTLPKYWGIGLVCGIILIVFEIIALIQSIIFKTLFSSNRKIKLKKDVPFNELPSVDIIISTYNEPLDVLRRTIIAASKVDYPKNKLNIYIGDDGKRDFVKDFCEEIGVHYITREDNKYAKAGNLNNVLEHSSGEFILVLDADMIPRYSIILDMIYYFEDSKCGFVQSPQVFYNHDIYQHNLKSKDFIPNEQDFFMRTILKKQGLFNAVLHVGSNAIFRRLAIEDIGGIPTSSITEDMATGMLVQSKGYRSFFVDKTLAVGLSVENVSDQIKQRDRWLRGNVQVFKKHNPLLQKGLNLSQKVIYLDGFLYWMHGLQKMIYIIAPLLYLIFRVYLFEAKGIDIAFMFLPYFISNALYFKRVSSKSRNLTWSHIYDTVLAPYMAWSFLISILPVSKLKFSVTPKGNFKYKDQFNIRLALPLIIMFIASIFAIILNISFLSLGNLFGGNISAILVNLFWCIYNGLALFISIFIYVDRKRLRRSERIPVDLKANGLVTSCNNYKKLLKSAKTNSFEAPCSSCGKIVDISENGARLSSNIGCSHFNFKIGEKIKLKVDTIGEIPASIVRTTEKDNIREIGVVFDELDFETLNNINKYRFSLNNAYVVDPTISKKEDSFIEIIVSIFR